MVMGGETNILDSQQVLKRLSRHGFERLHEVSVVASPGARAAAWAIKVESLSSYNVYNVSRIMIGDAGSLPVEIGVQTQAVNLAESFMQPGQLPAGTYAIMFRVGENNVFYAPV